MAVDSFLDDIHQSKQSSFTLIRKEGRKEGLMAFGQSVLTDADACYPANACYPATAC